MTKISSKLGEEERNHQGINEVNEESADQGDNNKSQMRRTTTHTKHPKPIVLTHDRTGVSWSTESFRIPPPEA